MKHQIRPIREGEQAQCEQILRSLPDWFGIEESIVNYVRDLQALETWVAEVSDEVVGCIAVNRHNQHAAEIHVMGVAAKHHGHGVGRAMIEHVETLLQQRGVEFLQVKTLGPSRPNEHYDRTRGFYMHLGFRPLEENHLWGDANPCLIMVKHLGCGGKPT